MLFELNKLIYQNVETGLLKWIHSLPRPLVKLYIKVRFWLQWAFLGVCAVLAWMPQEAVAQIAPITQPINPEGNGGTLPSYVPQSIDGLPGVATVTSLQLISDATSTFDTIWDTYLTNESPMFGVVLESTRFIVVVGFMFWVIAAVWKWVQNDYKKFPWQTIFLPLMIAILISNGGQLTIVGLQSYKQLVYKTNSAILSGTYGGLTGKDLIKQANTQQGLKNSYEEKRAKCREYNDQEKEKQCLEEIKAEIEAASKRLEDRNPGLSFDVGAAVGQSIAFVAHSFVVGLLAFIATTFHLIMAYFLAVWASSAPLWIALGMYPAGKSSLQIFASGLFAAMLSVWLYTILQIALASQMNTGLGLHGLLYPFLGGFVNPFIALFAGSMGFSSVMAASSVAGGAAIKLVKGLRGA